MVWTVRNIPPGLPSHCRQQPPWLYYDGAPVDCINRGVRRSGMDLVFRIIGGDCLLALAL